MFVFDIRERHATSPESAIACALLLSVIHHVDNLIAAEAQKPLDDRRREFEALRSKNAPERNRLVRNRNRPGAPKERVRMYQALIDEHDRMSGVITAGNSYRHHLATVRQAIDVLQWTIEPEEVIAGGITCRQALTVLSVATGTTIRQADFVRFLRDRLVSAGVDVMTLAEVA